MIVFWATFSSARFAAFGAQRDQIGGDRAKQSIEELGLFTRLAVRGIDGICVMMEAVQRAFEGNSLQVDIVGQGGSLHQGANEIVSDPMHRQLFENHLGGEAAQDIHAKHGFDLSEVQFDVPAPEIEFFQFLGRIKLRIEQRGDENDFFGAKTRNGNLKS